MKELLKLARHAIEAYLKDEEVKVSENINKKYYDKKACFVTLTENDELRGCMGSLEPRQELWKDVVENARNAAFSDPRFPAVIGSELKKIKIEISVLSIPKQISYKSLEELKQKIKNKGVILKQDYKQATYLPQVWDELENEEEFLSSLCMKAGMNGNAWQQGNIEVFVYDVEKIKE